MTRLSLMFPSNVPDLQNDFRPDMNARCVYFNAIFLHLEREQIYELRMAFIGTEPISYKTGVAAYIAIL